MKKINVYGAGGHCFAVIGLIKSLGDFSPNTIYDDAPSQNFILDVPVKKYTNEILSEHPLCIAIGNNAIRKKIANQFAASYPTFMHKSAVSYDSVLIGNGSVILPNAVLDAGAVVGDFCIVNNNATVSHNVVLGNYSHVAINSAIAGGVSIGEGTLVGAGSVILPEVTIGKWATIGAGSVITKDVPDYAVVYGNPASIQKYNKH